MSDNDDNDEDFADKEHWYEALWLQYRKEFLGGNLVNVINSKRHEGALSLNHKVCDVFDRSI